MLVSRCDNPACDNCGFKGTTNVGMADATAEEARHGAGRVEVGA
jgi:hypothetical protein